MKITLFVFLFFITHSVFAQDISGIWRGNFYSSSKISTMLNTEDRYKLEVQIDQRNKKIDGVSYSYKSTVFYGKAVANGTINPTTGKVRLEELKIVEIRMQENSYACVMTYYLQYTRNGDEEILQGDYTSYGEKDSVSCGKGKVYLRKVTTSDFYREPFLVRREKEKELNKTNIPPATSGKTNPSVAKAGTPVTPKAVVKKTVPGQKTVPPGVAKSTPKAPTSKTVPRSNTVSPPVAKSAPKATAKPPASVPSPKLEAEAPKPLKNKPITDIAGTDVEKEADRPAKKAIAVDLPRPLATRENELVKTIVINSNEVSINIYDNGTIDGDTVSVYLDKKLVVSRKLLTTNPISVKLELDEANPVHELVMVAENLGSIPPNTSLMVVKAGDKQYEVRITSTEQKNAVVVFRYERP